MTSQTHQDLLGLIAARTGHFRLESGHHGDLWLDLDSLFLRPRCVRPFATELASRLFAHGIEVVCGPLTGGAFLAQMIAEELKVDSCFSERTVGPTNDGVYSVAYRIPDAFRACLQGKRVAIVDDVINAGSAVRGTISELFSLGARPVAIGTLLVLGTPGSQFAAENRLPLESISHRAAGLWLPADCPSCAAGVPLEVPAH